MPDASAGVASKLAFETAADDATLAAAAGEWRALERRAAAGAQFYQSFGWVEAWWRCVGAPSGWRLRILLGRADGRLVLVWPLAIAPGRMCRTLAAAGGVLSPYSDAIVEPDDRTAAWLDAAVAAVAGWRDYDVVRLDDVRADAVIAPHLAGWLGPPVRGDAAVHVDCAAFAGFDAFFAAMSQKSRQNQRRSRKALAQRGAIRSEIDNGGAAVDAILRQAIGFKQDWLKERGLAHEVLESDVALDFLIAAARAGQADGTTVVSRLFLDGGLIAVGLGFLFNGRYNYYLGAFDQSLQELGPGRVQVEEALRWAFAHDVAAFDFMPPDTAAKAVWSRTKMPVESYMAGRGVAGAFWGSFYPRRLRPGLKRLYNVLPRGLHRAAGRLVRR